VDDDDWGEGDVSSLPQPVQMRIRALHLAVEHGSWMKPRMHAEDALDEIIALAERFIDEFHGGREKRLAVMPYREYLSTPEWDVKRRDAYRRAGYRCQLCNAGSVELHAHHRSYAKRGQSGEESDLIVLCARCHQRAHRFIFEV
jgi:HNH endonuclease